jgi:hypothetical protein
VLGSGALARAEDPVPDEAPAEKPAAAAPEPTPPPKEGFKIKPKASRHRSSEDSGGLLAPDVDVIDAPTAAALDYGGYSSRSRFYSHGGLLQYVSFGVYPGVNLGASLTVDGIVGNDTTVRVRAPNVQAKWRFYEGDRMIPSFAMGYDGQGYLYNQPDKRYNQRQRGFFIVASQELGLPGLMAHPSVNISDFTSNSIFGSIPVSYTIQDKVALLAEWDNINNFRDSRLNSGVRVYLTPHFNAGFSVRGIGQGGHYPDGNTRGPERVVELKYSGSF